MESILIPAALLRLDQASVEVLELDLQLLIKPAVVDQTMSLAPSWCHRLEQVHGPARRPKKRGPAGASVWTNPTGGLAI